MDGIQLAALYSLQHRLAGYTEGLSGLQHWKLALWGLLDKAGRELPG
jgi:hypothetical protein